MRMRELCMHAATWVDHVGNSMVHLDLLSVTLSSAFAEN